MDRQDFLNIETMTQSRRKVEPNVSTRKLTKILMNDYPEGTVIDFIDDDWQQRAGLVIKHAKGKVVVRSPVPSARAPKKNWGVTVPTPHLYRVPPERIVTILRRARRRTPSSEPHKGRDAQQSDGTLPEGQGKERTGADARTSSFVGFSRVSVPAVSV